MLPEAQHQDPDTAPSVLGFVSKMTRPPPPTKMCKTVPSNKKKKGPQKADVGERMAYHEIVSPTLRGILPSSCNAITAKNGSWHECRYEIDEELCPPKGQELNLRAMWPRKTSCCFVVGVDARHDSG